MLTWIEMNIYKTAKMEYQVTFYMFLEKKRNRNGRIIMESYMQWNDFEFFQVNRRFTFLDISLECSNSLK